MTISLVINTEGKVTKEYLDGYAALSNAVEGYIECVPSSDEVTMWCNEEGRVMNLDLNSVATQLWKLFDDYGCLNEGAMLVGPIVIQGPVDNYGECTDCPDWLFNRLGINQKVIQPAGVKVTCPSCKGNGSLMSNGVSDAIECNDCAGWGHTYE